MKEGVEVLHITGLMALHHLIFFTFHSQLLERVSYKPNDRDTSEAKQQYNMVKNRYEDRVSCEYSTLAELPPPMLVLPPPHACSTSSHAHTTSSPCSYYLLPMLVLPPPMLVLPLPHAYTTSSPSYSLSSRDALYFLCIPSLIACPIMPHPLPHLYNYSLINLTVSLSRTRLRPLGVQGSDYVNASYINVSDTCMSPW